MKHQSSTINSPTDSARLWRTELEGIELFEAHLQQHQFGKHFHETYTIGLNEGGQGCCQHQGTNHILAPGSFNLMNPGDIHTGQVIAEQGWAFRNLYIERSLLEQALEQMEWPTSGLPCFKEPILQPLPALGRLFDQ
ncbi:MAG: AraC family ligand binding domain-containing protein, partial [Cyanobacteria bacterium P01_H01_bin.152]